MVFASIQNNYDEQYHIYSKYTSDLKINKLLSTVYQVEAAAMIFWTLTTAYSLRHRKQSLNSKGSSGQFAFKFGSKSHNNLKRNKRISGGTEIFRMSERIT